VDNPSRRLVRRTVAGWNWALSTSRFLVPDCTDVFSPPMMPASATGDSASAMTRASFNGRVAPSRHAIVSPSRESRTTIRDPARTSRSNAWSGCPSSKRM